MTASAPPKTDNQYAIFLHIPKTAGTTLNEILKQQYGKKAMHWVTGAKQFESVGEMEQVRDGSIRLFNGHMCFGLHKFLPGEATYITFLRHPVDRAISLYYHIARNPKHPQYETIRDCDLSLKDYIESDMSTGDAKNFQTRILYGLSDEKPTNDREMLDIVKRNLRKYYAVVGLSERFEDSVTLMTQALGWSFPLWVDQNISKNRPSKAEESHDVRSLVESVNELDMELYEYASQLLEERIAELGDRFDRDYRKLQRVNQLYQPYGRLYSWARLMTLRHVLKRIP